MTTPDFVLTEPTLNAFLKIALFFVIAAVIAALSGRLSNRLLSLRQFAFRARRLSAERQNTLHGLLANGISLLAYGFALLFSLSLFVSATTIVWVVGLFSAAFGLAARPLVSDVLAGISFMFNETFDLGEKVELFIPGTTNIQGVMEAVNLTTSQVRAPTGELYTVPNGEIRVVRNFSRGKFSTVNIVFSIATDDLPRALDSLRSLGDDIYKTGQELVEPWQVLNTSGLTGGRIELTIIARVGFGKAAEMKPVLSNRVYDCLKSESITIL